MGQNSSSNRRWSCTTADAIDADGKANNSVFLY